MADPINLNAVERRAADLLACRHAPGAGPGGWRSLADVRPFELQRIIVDDVLTLSGAGLLVPVEPTSPPVRVSRGLPRTYPVGPARAGFDRVTVELPWGHSPNLARELADGLARGETTLVFPPGAVVTYGKEPEPAKPAKIGGMTTQPTPAPTAAETVRVSIFTTSGNALVVERMPFEDANALVKEFRAHPSLYPPAPVLVVTPGDNAVSHLARAHIVRIDLDFDA